MGNHDRSRTASRYGEELIDTMNMLNMMLPGASITYNVRIYPIRKKILIFESLNIIA